MTQEKTIKEKVQIPKSENKLNRSNKDICEDYLRSPINFKIYFENRVLFDSSASDRSNVIFYDNYFTVYGKNFPYKGMRITKYRSF